MTIVEHGARQTLQFLKEELEKAGIQDAESESRILLEWICGIDRAAYYMDQNALIPPGKWEELLEVLKKRTDHIPLQYLMGMTEFMGFPFYVDERVLIPRPDTECLVEYALELLNEMETVREPGGGCDKGALGKVQVLDLCSGSGCIGISISKLCPCARVTLADISEGALALAGRNADKLHAQVRLACGDLFEALRADGTETVITDRADTEQTRPDSRFHMIVSNPPYIPTGVIDTLMPEVKDHEPVLALDGEEDGLGFYRRIIRQAGDYLYPGGWLVFEIGMDQGEDLRRLFAQAGYRDVTVRQDLAGLDRIAAGRMP